MKGKRAVIIFCFLALSIAVCSCRQSAETKVEFTQEELLEDYDQLWAGLRENYPFFPILEDKGLNTASLQQTYRELILSRVENVEGFVGVLSNMFSAMDNFAHLGVADAATFSIYHDEYQHHLDSGKQLNAWDKAVSEPQTEEIYSYLSSRQVSGGENTYPQVQTAYYPELKAAYFSFPTFNYSLVERDSSVVFDYLASLGDKPVEHIIFDVTANSGGSDSYWINNIVMPFGGKYTVESTVYLKDSPMSREYFGNFNLHPLSSLPEGETAPEFTEQLGLTLFFTSQYLFSNEGGSIQTVSAKAQQARRWVLTDSYTFSGADSFAEFCKQTNWATLVGQNTMGDGGIGFSSCFLALKNTGLLVRFSIEATSNASGELNALNGTPPDIFAKPNEAPLSACKRLIENAPG